MSILPGSELEHVLSAAVGSTRSFCPTSSTPIRTFSTIPAVRLAESIRGTLLSETFINGVSQGLPMLFDSWVLILSHRCLAWHAGAMGQLGQVGRSLHLVSHAEEASGLELES